MSEIKQRLTSVFMGTPELAVPTLQALAELTDCQLVVTQPDRQAGRGRQLRAPPVKVAAEALGVPVWQPETLRGHEDDPRFAVDLIVVMAYGELLRQPLLDRPRWECVNVHLSLLPRWRGASPLQAALAAGDAATGVTIMRMVKALDAGPMFRRDELPLQDRSTLSDVHDALAELAPVSLRAFLAAGREQIPQEQDAAAVTWCGKLSREDGCLDWTQPWQAIDRHVRSYTPVPGCWSALGKKSWRIQAIGRAPSDWPNLAPGHIKIMDNGIAVGTGDVPAALLQAQPPGKRSMAVADLLNGYAQQLDGQVFSAQ
jgi:methionyl-tRNA formyltransferase